MRFQDQTVIVTGGGKGIGREITKQFIDEGANCVICGRNAPNEPITGADFIPLDIRRHDAGQALTEFTLEKTGRIDVLVNNAGGGPPVPSQDASPTLTEKIIALNLIAPLTLSQAAFAALRERKGSIINIASVSGVRGSPGTAAYGAAKAGLLNLTQSLAMEWAPDIRVNAIVAGLIKTNASHDHYGGEAGLNHLASQLPMKRMGSATDIAKACLFLADQDNDYVSGASFEVFGGGEPPSFLKIVEEAQHLKTR